MRGMLSSFSDEEKAVYSLISVNDGLMAKEIASLLSMERKQVNHLLFSSPLMHELCFQDMNFRWHALIRQAPVHEFRLVWNSQGIHEYRGGGLAFSAAGWLPPDRQEPE